MKPCLLSSWSALRDRAESIGPVVAPPRVDCSFAVEHVSLRTIPVVIPTTLSGSTLESVDSGYGRVENSSGLSLRSPRRSGSESSAAPDHHCREPSRPSAPCCASRLVSGHTDTVAPCARRYDCRRGKDNRSPYQIARRLCPTLGAMRHGESRLCGQVSINLNVILSGDEIGLQTQLHHMKFV
jgi:hypothetical protein